MKCPKCKGYGYYEKEEDGIIELIKCECQYTNEEWMRTATTEQLAEFLFIIGEDNWLTDISNRDEIMPHEKDVVEWLKEVHKDEV